MTISDMVVDKGSLVPGRTYSEAKVLKKPYMVFDEYIDLGRRMKVLVCHDANLYYFLRKTEEGYMLTSTARRVREIFDPRCLVNWVEPILR